MISRPRAFHADQRRKRALGQRIEAARCDGGQQIALFRKVLVGRVVADAGAPRHFAQRKRPILSLVKERERRFDERRGEIAVMIGPSGGGGPAAGGFGHGKNLQHGS